MRRLVHQGELACRRARGAALLAALGLLLVAFGPGWPMARAAPFDGKFDGYRVESVAFDLVGLDAATNVSLADDEMTGQLDLGFASRFYNEATTNFWISSNGFISLFKKEDPGCCEGQSLPDPADPDGLVAGFWANLDPAAGGSVAFQSFSALARSGLPAQNAAVARWQDVPVVGGAPVTFEVLFLEDGTLEVQVDHAAAPAGTNATVGIENFNGSRAVQVARGALDLEHVAWRLTPVYIPLVPDLVVQQVRVVAPTLPTDPWTVKVSVLNNGTGNWLQAQVRVTVVAAPGPLRGTSPGCPSLVGTKSLYEFAPGQGVELRYLWAPPVDPSNPGPPRVGAFEFDAVGIVLQSAQPERVTGNNAGSATAAFLTGDLGGTDLLCQRVPGLPGMGQAPARPGGA